MVLIISPFTSVGSVSLPFHVDRFNKNAVGLIVYVYMIWCILSLMCQRGLDMKCPLTCYYIHFINGLRATRSRLCSEIPFNSTYTYTHST
jgi:hypothetical protein